MNTTEVAIGAIILIVVARDAAIWSLFWKRGWRVMVPVQKTAGSATTDAVAGGKSSGDAPPATVPIDKGRSAA